MSQSVALVTDAPEPTSWETAVRDALAATGYAVEPSPTNAGLLIDLSERGTGFELAEKLGIPLLLLCHGADIRFDLSASIQTSFVAHEPFIEIRMIEWSPETKAGRTVQHHRLRRRKTPDRSVAAVTSAAPGWFAQALALPHTEGDEQGLNPTSGTAPAPWRLKAATLGNIAATLIDLFTAEEWNVGVAAGDAAKVFEPDLMRHVDWLPRNRSLTFRADPFGWRADDGATVLLYETFDYREGKGRIVRNIGGREEVIGDFPYHASYPFLFEKDGQRYAVPELSEMARPAAFPIDKDSAPWTGQGIPLKGMEGIPLSDGTIFFHGDRYWLFGMYADQESNAVLHAWHAPDHFGPWTPHAGNPIKTDITCSRPGGLPFDWQGHTIRPTQDCSTSYGAAIVLNRIDVLTPTEFKETTIARIDPDPQTRYRHGLHTLNVVDGLIIVDAKRHVRHPLAPVYRWLRVQRSKRRAIVPS